MHSLHKHTIVKNTGYNNIVGKQYAVYLEEAFEHNKKITTSYLINIKANQQTPQHPIDYLINREQVFINGEAPNTLVDKCIDYSGKCIFPLVVNLNAHDDRLETVANYDTIQSRWLIAKDRLRLDYKGEVLDKIIDQMEHALSSAQFVTKAIKNNLFFQLYFFPLYIGHSHIKGIEINHAFSIVANTEPVKFTCTREVTNNNKDGISMDVKGKANDKRSFTDIAIAKINSNEDLEINDLCQGSAQLTYELSANGIIKSVKGNLEIKGIGNNFRSVDVSITQNEQVSLTDKNFEPAIKPIVYAKKKRFLDRFK